MNADEIGKIINPQYPWVYAPTTAPTKLIFKDGTTIVGYFQYTKRSAEMEKEDKFSFLQLGANADQYRATGDESFVNIVDGNQLYKVEYPSYPKNDITPEYIIGRIEELRTEFAMLSLSLEEILRKVALFRLDWGIGSLASDSEHYNLGSTKAVILDKFVKKESGLSRRYDYSGQPLEILQSVIIGGEINTNLVQALHKSIVDGEGEYRRFDVDVHRRTPSSFKFSAPESIATDMDKLVDWYNNAQKDETIHFLLLAAQFHYDFVAIHPFGDGNGRIARTVTSAILLRHNVPPPILGLEDRIFYLDTLQRADEGDVEPWIVFLGKKVIASMETLLNTI